LFAHFAFMTNIPFECYMFSDRTDDYSRSIHTPKGSLQQIGMPESGRLIGLVNTNTDRRSFKKQVQMVLCARASYVSQSTSLTIPTLPYMTLGGTPLFAGMMLMERHVERMKRTLRLDKMMAVLITDGADTAGLPYTANVVNNYAGTVQEGKEILGRTAFVARDTVTKKN